MRTRGHRLLLGGPLPASTPAAPHASPAHGSSSCVTRSSPGREPTPDTRGRSSLWSAGGAACPRPCAGLQVGPSGWKTGSPRGRPRWRPGAQQEPEKQSRLKPAGWTVHPHSGGPRGHSGQRERERPCKTQLELAPTLACLSTHLDMRHQLRLLQEQEGALGALEHAHLSRAGVLVKVLLDVPLFVEDHLAGALIDEPVVTRAVEGPGEPGAVRSGRHSLVGSEPPAPAPPVPWPPHPRPRSLTEKACGAGWDAGMSCGLRCCWPS